MSNEIDREMVKLWRIWKTAHQMCADRGYEISESELDLSLDDFRAKYLGNDGRPDRAGMSFSAQPTPVMIKKYQPLPTMANPEPAATIGPIRIEFNAHKGIGVAEFKKFVHSITEANFFTGVLISAGSVTPSALKVIPTVAPRIIEVFHEQDLLVNVTQHELVPKHVLLSVADKKALLERYRVKETQLPRIQVGDPVARYLGLRRGQVVKIIRRSETAGRYASYRWCL